MKTKSEKNLSKGLLSMKVSFFLKIKKQDWY